MRRLLLAVIVSAVALGAACGGSGSGGGDDPGAGFEVSAEVASFDLAVDRDERFTVGFFAPDNRVLAYGDVTLRFGFAGTADAPEREITPGSPVEAGFLPVPGQDIDPDRPGPRLVAPSEARGVYGADGVVFDRPGNWIVTAAGDVDGEPFEAQAAFQVNDEPQVVAVGDPAPATRNPLPGDPSVPPAAIDSRAEDSSVPDPELHSTTVADALAAGRPLVVVASTPVFCTSRFCGPITDAVAELAREYGDRVDFVHLEIWQDFENQVVNPSAGEWIFPRDGGNAREPWVFVVAADGVVQARFDNVATEPELRAAVEAVAGT
ncbi:MAG TPA: hypothetical protein VF152_03305 [Acidimicrobiia bacterium]